MKVAILGFGSQGRSAYEYWSELGHDITICDGNEQIELPENVGKQLGPDHQKNLDQFDLIVRSPIVHPRDIVANNSEEILEKVTTVTNEFFKVCPSRNIIGVTGTKGKGTTSTLIARMLEADGKKIHLGGNIGTPPLDLLKRNIQPTDWVVLELANFQLIDLKYSPKVAVCLMVAPEHLDWHEENDEYIEAKQQLFRRQKPEDTAIYYAQNPASEHVASISSGQKIPYMRHPGAAVIENKIVIDGNVICSTDEIKLLGKHNWQNICAAVTAAWQVSQNVEAMKSAITSFSGMEHRLELVREAGKIKYYDDSFGTTPETAIVAIEAFTEPKILILGGSDKGADYTQLAEAVAKNNVRQVITIGQTGPAITQALKDQDYNNIVKGPGAMPEIVQMASELAQPGDIVLLSTACASFDMFENYKDRGEQFKKAVNSL